MSEQFDVIVAGVGGFGSSCLYHLAKQGRRVLGLDRFPPGHDRGSSHGDTRIIRQAYFEHPDYVPLLLHAYDLWRELESESGRDLLTVCGLMLSGPPDGEVITGAFTSSREHGIAIESVARSDAADRFPGFRIPEGFDAVFEPQGGFLRVEDCVHAHVELACGHTAECRSDEPVIDWTSDGRTVRVRTEHGEYEAAALVITAGAWAADLLTGGSTSTESATAAEEIASRLEVRRKPLLWNPVRSDAFNLDNGGCGFLFEMPEGYFYGFPSLDGQTVKLAEHTGGEVVIDPLHLDRSLRDSDVNSVAQFASKVMPGIDPKPLRHSICMYTLTPDSHFLVDRHPAHDNVWFGAGFSGHGFKFTSVIGEALAELATEGRTGAPVGFLGAGRLF